MDPITFEILRHRLWMINDEQGKIIVPPGVSAYVDRYLNIRIDLG